MRILRKFEGSLDLGGLRPLCALLAAIPACWLYSLLQNAIIVLIRTGELHAPIFSIFRLPDILVNWVSIILPCLWIAPLALLAGRSWIFLVYIIAGLVLVGSGEIFAALSPYRLFNTQFSLLHPQTIGYFLYLLSPWLFLGLFLQLFANRTVEEADIDDFLNGFRPYLALLLTCGIGIALLAARYLIFLIEGYGAPFLAVGASTANMLIIGPNPFVGIVGGMAAIVLTHRLRPMLAIPAYVALALLPSITAIGISPSLWHSLTRFGIGPLAYGFGIYLAGIAVYGVALLAVRQRSSLPSHQSGRSESTPSVSFALATTTIVD